MKLKNENYNNDKPVCKKEYENKCRTKFLDLFPITIGTNSYRDNNLDLKINESLPKKIFMFLFFIR